MQPPPHPQDPRPPGYPTPGDVTLPVDRGQDTLPGPGHPARANQGPGWPPPGGVFGPYQLQEEMARGGQGAVYRAQHIELGRTVALKVLLAPDPRSIRRFRQEAQVLERLDHPNLPRVHDLGVVQQVPFLAMELVEGEDLKRFVKRLGAPDPDWIGEVLGAVAEALHHCHEQGVVHRDVKPANIIIERGTSRPVLVDFGLIKRDPEKLSLGEGDQSKLSRSGETKGTPSYMAPEQADSTFGEEEPRTDVYGLGATLYHLLCGEPPFTGTTSYNVIVKLLRDPPPDPARDPTVPPGLARVCRTAMARRQADRYASCQELADALRSAGEARPRSRGLALAGGVVAVVAAVALLAGPLGSEPPAPASKPAPAPAPSKPAPTSPQLDERAAAETLRVADELLQSGQVDAVDAALQRLASAGPRTRSEVDRLRSRVRAYRNALGTAQVAVGRMVNFGTEDGLDTTAARDRAGRAVEEALTIAPRSLAAQLAQAQLLDLELRFAEAVELLEQMVARRSSGDFGRGDLYQACLLLAVLRPDRARSLLTEAIRLRPRRYEAHTRRGLLSVNDSKLLPTPGCEADLLEALERGKDVPEVHRNLGNLYWALGERNKTLAPPRDHRELARKAEVHYDRALELDPRDTRTLDLRALLHKDSGRTKEEDADYQRAVNLTRKRLHGRVGYFILLARYFNDEARKGRLPNAYRLAVTCYRRALQEDYRDACATHELAMLRWWKHAEVAVRAPNELLVKIGEQVHEALERNPRIAERDAERVGQTLIERVPRHELGYRLLSKALRRQGKIAEAEKVEAEKIAIFGQ